MLDSSKVILFNSSSLLPWNILTWFGILCRFSWENCVTKWLLNVVAVLKLSLITMLPCSSYIGLTVSFTFSCDLVLRLSLITLLPCSSSTGVTVSFTSSCDLVLRLSLITLLPCSSYIGLTVSFTFSCDLATCRKTLDLVSCYLLFSPQVSSLLDRPVLMLCVLLSWTVYSLGGSLSLYICSTISVCFSWLCRSPCSTIVACYINNNNKKTSLAPISSENPSSVAQQNQRIRHSRNHVQCKKSSTDGWRCQEAKEDRPFWKYRIVTSLPPGSVYLLVPL